MRLMLCAAALAGCLAYEVCGQLPAPQSIPGLFNTGVDDQGRLLPDGAVDPHWRLIQSADGAGPGPSAYALGNVPVVWLANGPSSRWISPRSNTTTAAAGEYVYRLVFSLAGFEPATAMLEIRMSSDNATREIRLNGQPTGWSYSGAFGAFSPIMRVTDGFVAGENTLDFVVNNAGLDPTGLRVEISGTALPLAPPGTAPVVIADPADRTVPFAGRTTLYVRAYGSKPLHYQWRHDGVPLAGTDAAQLVLEDLTEDNAGSYDVIITNAYGAVTSAVARVAIAYFTGPCSRRTPFVFSEIMYHPADRPDGRNLEFIEIYNSNPFPEDLGGYRIEGDVTYTFPAGTRVAGGGFIVVAAVPSDLEAVYGLSGVFGPWTNDLPNDSGLVRLRKPSGAVVLEVRYSDRPPWPVAADGAGPSLVCARPSYGENDPRAWLASRLRGGSPGTVDSNALGTPASGLETVRINEVLASATAPDEDFVELFNAGSASVDVSGCWLSDSPRTNKFRIPTNTVLQPGAHVAFSATQLGFGLKAEGDDVFLFDPSLTRVLDAIGFSGQAPARSSGRYPDGGEEWQELSAVTPGQANAAPSTREIVINEIMYHPVSENPADEYVELYNQGEHAVDVGGWQFVDGIDFALPVGTVIPAGGYLVVAKDRARLLATHPNLSPSVVVGDYTGELANGGEHLALALPIVQLSTNTSMGVITTNIYFVVADEVTYRDGGRWGQWADGGGSSLELRDPRSDNRRGSNWADSDETRKAPWTLIEKTATLGEGHPLITVADQLHVMLLGTGEVLLDDVELVVNGANRVANGDFENGVNGWFFQGTHRPSYWEQSDGYNSVGSLHLVATGKGDLINRARTGLTAQLTPGMTVTFRARARWLRGHPELLMRVEGGFAEAFARLALPLDLGTPGARNSVFETNVGPAIEAVRHSPLLPAGGEPIVVSARVSDPDGIGQVQLRYRIDPSSTLRTVLMRDDGLGGDARAGDGIYSATLPGQSAGVLVAFHVVATDSADAPALSTFPAGAPSRECLVRFGSPPDPNAFGTYRFWVTRQNIDFWTRREKSSNEDVDATFVYGTDRVIYNIGARYAGSDNGSTRYDSPTGFPGGYKLTFPKDEPFLGEDEVRLDYTDERDPTLQREPLMYWFLEQLGLPNMYRRYVNLYLNGVRRGKLYADAQRPERATLEEWWPEDSRGDLFKTTCWYEFTEGGTVLLQGGCVINRLDYFFTPDGERDMERYRWTWRPRAIRGTANDFTNLFALIDALHAPTPAYEPTVESLVDVEHWMRTFCMNDLASFWDAFGNPNSKNTYLYKPERSGWKLMCWDFDVGLGVFNDPPTAALFPANVDPAVARMYATPAFVRGYWRALEESLNTFFKPEVVEPILDERYAAFVENEIEAVSPFVPSGQYGLSIPDWIAQRRSFLLSQLASVQTGFRVNPVPAVVTDRNVVTLSGTAPVRVARLLVNDRGYPTDWTTVTSWSIEVPLQPGTNVLTLTALDRTGTPISEYARTITVNYAGPVDAPEEQVVLSEIMYHPLEDRAGYVELYNRSDTTTFDLSGWRIEGVDFAFPAGSLIRPGESLVVVEDRVKFAQAYGWDLPVYYELGRTLDRTGGILRLTMPGQGTNSVIEVDGVAYASEPPWPAAAAGEGAALQRVDPAQPGDRVSNWSAGGGWQFFSFTASSSIGGSRLSLFFEADGGDIYLDDIQLVEGETPDAGPNLLNNGDFEEALAPAWQLGPLAAQTTRVTERAHSGSHSLHLVIEPGAPSLTTFYQTLPPVARNTPHTLSFWWQPGRAGTRLTLRLNAVFQAKLTPSEAAPRATPAAPNSVFRSLPAYPPVWLSEVQAQNTGAILDEAGDADPWVELYHAGDAALDLSGFFLSDDPNRLDKWTFPSGTMLGPQAYLVVWADAEPAEGPLHLDFRLAPTNGIILLSRSIAGELQVVDYLTYAGLEAGASYGAFPPGQGVQRQGFPHPTPGAPNDPSQPAVRLWINEWMAANRGSVRDPFDGDAEDWFEIYNPSEQAIDLGGFTFTDDPSQPGKFLVPKGYVVPPHGFLIVWADGEPEQNTTTDSLHVNFKLSRSGEAIGLFATDGTQVDLVSFGPQLEDVSEGRLPDGEGTIQPLPRPTPGASNQEVSAIDPPRILSVRLTGERVLIELSSQPGIHYQVEFQDELGPGTWQAIGAPVVGTGQVLPVEDPTPNPTQRFYRVRAFR